MQEYNKPRQSNTLRPGLYADVLPILATIRLPRESFEPIAWQVMTT